MMEMPGGNSEEKRTCNSGRKYMPCLGYRTGKTQKALFFRCLNPRKDSVMV